MVTQAVCNANGPFREDLVHFHRFVSELLAIKGVFSWSTVSGGSNFCYREQAYVTKHNTGTGLNAVAPDTANKVHQRRVEFRLYDFFGLND